MKKRLTIPEAKRELEKYSPEKVKEIVLSMGITGDVGPALNKLKDKLLPIWMHGTPAEQLKIEKEFKEKVTSVMYGFEADTHVSMMESFSERFRGGAKEICKQFIRDFDCKTDAEKILAETAAIGFMRYLDASRRLNSCLDFSNSTSPEKNVYLSMLSKERDRSHRQYLSTVSMIKQLKAPHIEMNIKTKTAFVAQNQQINASTPGNQQKPTNSENNEAK